MNRLFKEEDGFFTLIEGIIVLTIVSFILAMPSIQMRPLGSVVSTDIFLEQLKSDITLLHQNAVLNGETTVIEANPGRNRINLSVISNSASPLNKTIQLPEQLTMFGGYKRFSYRPYSGNITNVDRIRFSDSNRTFEFVFQVGSGRFYVREI